MGLRYTSIPSACNLCMNSDLCIGSARCMVDAADQSKHQLLLEALSNHSPEVCEQSQCL